MSCSNCGWPIRDHRCGHLIPHCPGKCRDIEDVLDGGCDGERVVGWLMECGYVIVKSERSLR